ncbi:MAG: bis-aminopropyl spermidine synthase family protein [Patescibacteria group bacterium]|nr:bis-aminopropyl spermidine synthase family protein [Patescibacteria group bacterium]
MENLVESDLYWQSIKLFSYYKNNIPYPKRNYDQFTATIETTVKRVALLDFLGDVKGKRILFLGDDDFTSVAIANFKLAQEIAVIDIDGRILDNIGTISDKLNLGIKRIKQE